ncbi:hypothetical protein ONZ45_g14845 [Pleurotus djamor]|nr:hypothetical protein ONZ45_g14845 [Pleurotus djamor]
MANIGDNYQICDMSVHNSQINDELQLPLRNDTHASSPFRPASSDAGTPEQIHIDWNGDSDVDDEPLDFSRGTGSVPVHAGLPVPVITDNLPTTLDATMDIDWDGGSDTEHDICDFSLLLQPNTLDIGHYKVQCEGGSDSGKSDISLGQADADDPGIPPSHHPLTYPVPSSPDDPSPRREAQPFPLDDYDWSMILSPTADIGPLLEEDSSSASSDEVRSQSPPCAPHTGPLCDFCDGPLPLSPSKFLEDFRKRFDGSCHPAPTILNRHHKITLKTVERTEYCHRHHVEANILPQASANGWPLEIDFALLQRRVESHFPELEDIIHNLHDNPLFRQSCELRAPAFERSWMLFETRNSGYYGEGGYAIVSTLLRLTFSESLDKTQIAPLTASNVIDEVLLAETFIFLVQEDRGCDRSEAIAQINASRTFGVHQYPFDHDNVQCVLRGILRRRRVTVSNM